MKFIWSAVSKAGSRKPVNEDSCYVQIEETIYGEACLAVVCDGVGGLQYGDRAGKYVVRKLGQWFKKFSAIRFESTKDIIPQMNSEIMRINEELIQMGKEAGVRLGTTLSAMLFLDGMYYLFHVGDTRIYQCTNVLRCLSFDHTILAAKIRNGQMTEEEAEQSDTKHVLLQCIGVNEILEIQNANGEVHKDDVFLLCSDGQYNKLNFGEMEDVMEEMKELEQNEMQEIAETLVSEVINREEKDDITSIFLKVE